MLLRLQEQPAPEDLAAVHTAEMCLDVLHLALDVNGQLLQVLAVVLRRLLQAAPDIGEGARPNAVNLCFSPT